MPETPYVLRPDLTGIVNAFKNEEETFIADEIYPRVPVNDTTYEWDNFDDATFFNLYDDQVGPTSRPNEIFWNATKFTGAVVDHYLQTPIPYADLETDSGKLFQLEKTGSMFVTNAILLNREKRAADATFTAANYPADQRVTLSGTSQWSHVDSDPIPVIKAALRKPWQRPSHMVFGAEAWDGFSSNRKIVEAVLGTGAAQGNVTEQQVADLFRVSKVLIGEAKANSAALGQAITQGFLWGKHVALLYINPLARNTVGNPPTWGITPQLGNRYAGTIQDGQMGGQGGEWVRVGERVNEHIVSNRCGYLFTNAVA